MSKALLAPLVLIKLDGKQSRFVNSFRGKLLHRYKYGMLKNRKTEERWRGRNCCEKTDFIIFSVLFGV